MSTEHNETQTEEDVATTDIPEEVVIPTDTEDDSADAPEDRQDEDDNGNKEAAKYRRKLREAEAERDNLAATVTALRRTQAEAAAAEILQKPSALWSIGTEISELLADDGTIDVEKVQAAARAAIDDVGLAPKQIGFHMDMTGRNAGHRRSGDLFTEAFSPRRS